MKFDSFPGTMVSTLSAVSHCSLKTYYVIVTTIIFTLWIRKWRLKETK